MNKKEFISLYRKKIRPELRSLEKSRIKLRNNILFISPFALVAFACLSIDANSKNQANTTTMVFICGVFFAIVSALYAGVSILPKYKAYRRMFKQKVIGTILEFIAPSLKLKPNQMVKESTFKKSKLFTNYNTYKGDDYISGLIGDTKVEFSELNINKRKRSPDGKTRSVRVFHGIFFSADFNKHLQSETILRPDVAEQMFGSLGNALQSKLDLVSDQKLTILENKEFEKVFKVQTTDPIEARYCLTPKLMESFLEINKRHSKTLHASFIDTRVNIAIPFNRNLFEPNIFSTAINSKEIVEMAMMISNLVRIVDDLDLNTRIWTKTA